MPLSRFPEFTSADSCAHRLGQYYDSSSQRHFIVAEPAAQPALWNSYLRGAYVSYRKYGVSRVLEYQKVADGKSTALFFAALDDDGRVAGGMRVQGPYQRADQAHALEEWAGRHGTTAIRAEISARITGGVIEMKTGWVRNNTVRREELTAAIARIFVHSMNLMDVRHAFGTVATHAVPRWQTTGGVVSVNVAPVAYPDDRYLTRLMWWDRETYADLTAPQQLPQLLDESAQLRGCTRTSTPTSVRTTR